MDRKTGFSEIHHFSNLLFQHLPLTGTCQRFHGSYKAFIILGAMNNKTFNAHYYKGKKDLNKVY